MFVVGNTLALVKVMRLLVGIQTALKIWRDGTEVVLAESEFVDEMDLVEYHHVLGHDMQRSQTLDFVSLK